MMGQIENGSIGVSTHALFLENVILLRVYVRSAGTNAFFAQNIILCIQSYYNYNTSLHNMTSETRWIVAAAEPRELRRIIILSIIIILSSAGYLSGELKTLLLATPVRIS
jgi:hypothetical protein